MSIQSNTEDLSSYLLTGANAFSIGVLGMSGMLLMSGVPVAIGTFFFASSIECDVNYKNIHNGIKHMFRQNDLIMQMSKHLLLQWEKKKEALEKEKEEALEKKEAFEKEEELAEIKKNAFLKLYQQQHQYRKDLKKFHPRNREEKNLQKELLQFYKEELFWNRLYFIDSMINAIACHGEYNAPLIDDINEQLNRLKITPETFFKQYTDNQIKNRFYMITGLLSGIGTGFITAFATHVGLTNLFLFLGITVGSAVMPAIIIPSAIFGGLAYHFVTYNTLYKITVYETIKENWGKIFGKKTLEERWKKILFGLATLIILSLGVVVTVATFTTWSHGILNGAKLSALCKDIANYIRAITVPFVALGAFAFNIENSLATIWYLQKIEARKKLREIWKELTETYDDNESFLERINPGRALHLLFQIPLKAIIFLGHVISVGAMTDRIGNLSPVAVTFLSASAEAGEDLVNVVSDADAHHGHSHGFTDFLVRVALLIPDILDFIWRSGCSIFTKKSFGENLRKAFHHHQHGHTPFPETPKPDEQDWNTWQTQKTLLQEKYKSHAILKSTVNATRLFHKKTNASEEMPVNYAPVT